MERLLDELSFTAPRCRGGRFRSRVPTWQTPIVDPRKPGRQPLHPLTATTFPGM